MGREGEGGRKEVSWGREGGRARGRRRRGRGIVFQRPCDHASRFRRFEASLEHSAPNAVKRIHC